MAQQTFSWCPRVGAQADTQFRVLQAQFGDGYRQTAADGINNFTDQWELEFVGKAAYILPIKQFLDEHGGWRSFLWVPPLREEGSYTAGRYSVSAMGAGVYALRVTFIRNWKP